MPHVAPPASNHATRSFGASVLYGCVWRRVGSHDDTISVGVCVNRRVVHTSSWQVRLWLVCRPAGLLLPVVLALSCMLTGQGADSSAALQDAVAALQRGDFPSAERKLRAELKLHPNDAETLSLLGLALDNQKKFPEADAIHRRAIAAAPGSTRAFGNYGNHLLLTGDEIGARDAFQ